MSSNYFEQFNLPTSFVIDEAELEKRYIKLQQQFHPDAAIDQTSAEINSILINQAYQILKNPIKRAIYLLELQNININSEECVVKPDVDTLNLVMNLREEIFENKNSPQIIIPLKQKIKNIIRDDLLKVASDLKQEKYALAAQNLIRIKYLDKILSDLKIN